jgi:hypothetical protein
LFAQLSKLDEQVVLLGFGFFVELGELALEGVDFGGPSAPTGG